MLGDTTFPFRVNKTIKDRIGSAGLHQLGKNLWPVDCQTCGRPLDGEVPSLVVSDMSVVAMAALHHPGCQQPHWAENVITVARGDYLTYRTRTGLIPTEAGGKPVSLPLMLVNPGLEQVSLRPEGSGWRVATMKKYQEDCGLTEIVGAEPVPDAYAQVTPSGWLIVVLERTHEAWEFDISAPAGMKERILELGGVGLGVTTAYLPTDHFVTLGDFIDAMRSGQLALGWISLRR
ncbi:hypothetical protein [Nocardia grenadensis]|uniref:hypothetical protein n=1 Tax=Nocardia grenadensis TaxID=931537 RepID=UPI0007A4E65C|nr:hypothetical protein [Nocardia grenadensis]